MRSREEYIKRVDVTEIEDDYVFGFIELPSCGKATVMVGTNEDGYDHVSVAPKNKLKIPSWSDMAYIKNIFFDDDEEVYQIHPPKSEYVNMKENCLHLWHPMNKRRLYELVEERK